MEKIKIENLTFTYPQSDATALKEINVTVQSGAFVVLCGKSGCGKSTLLRSIKPTLAPHGEKTGNVWIDGVAAEALTLREQTEKIGFVFQDPSQQVVCDKVWHEMAFSAESLGQDPAEIRARVAEVAAFFGIQHWFYRDVATLSGGQLQLLNLASVMVMQPSLLILDEPTAQLDPIAAHEFFAALKRINQEIGTTILLSEHRLKEVLPLADRVIVMEHGEILTEGSPGCVAAKLQDCRHEMLAAFPASMRLYAAKGGGRAEDMPITVQDGRRWLSKIPVVKELDPPMEQPPEGEQLLCMKDVWFRYERELADVLKGVRLSLHAGEWYSMVGANGAGKTTVLSLLLSIRKPYRGSVWRKDGVRIAALPQNPRDLFSHKTVRENLWYVLDESPYAKEEREEMLQRMVRFCELEELMERHPYDLSGGQQQRAALAMVLLTNPKVLLLDEPTKGLDAAWKEKLAGLLGHLKDKGIGILMVSHDIEFCARYADRCGMFFDGQILSEGTPRRFFDQKSFYTTDACRMARGIILHAVLEEDIAEAVGIAVPQIKCGEPPSRIREDAPPQTPDKDKRDRLSVKRIVTGSIFALIFLVSELVLYRRGQSGGSLWLQIISLVFAGAACQNFILQREIPITAAKRETKKTVGKTAVIYGVLMLIPLTVAAGVWLLRDRKYYFISLLIILEAMLAFAVAFEGRRPKAREVVLISVLCALTVAGRTAFAALPQFKPVVALVIITGACLGGETGFLVGAVSAFVSNFFFGQGPWTPWQMFALGSIGLVSGVLMQKGILRPTKIGFCVFGFFATILLYGGITNFASVLFVSAKPTREAVVSVYALGLPFDLIHAVSTVFFLWFASGAMCEKLERVKTKYGLYP